VALVTGGFNTATLRKPGQCAGLTLFNHVVHTVVAQLFNHNFHVSSFFGHTGGIRLWLMKRVQLAASSLHSSAVAST
jgi:hypothetical protein